MKNIFYDSNKLPEFSEFTKRYFQIVLFNFIILVIFFLLLPGKSYEKLIYFSMFFIFLMIATRIELIKLLIIKRIDHFSEKKSELSQSRELQKDYLLPQKIAYKSFKSKERAFKIVIVVSIIVFLKFIGNSPQNKFYLTWTYSFTTLSIVLFFSSHNIFKYFQKLIGSLLECVDFQKHRSNELTENNRVSLNIQQYIKKLKILQFISLLSVVVISLILILLGYQSVIAYLPVFLIAVLGIVALDLNRVIKIALLLLSRYDSFIKGEVK